MDNPNPEIRVVSRERSAPTEELTLEQRIFECIRTIRDPEHPNTLEELSVVDDSSVSIVEPEGGKLRLVRIQYTPTVPHCSMASVIGLCIRAKLKELDIPRSDVKVHVEVAEGSHQTDRQITKQINDKERVAAALENPNLRAIVDDCLVGVQDHVHEVLA